MRNVTSERIAGRLKRYAAAALLALAGLLAASCEAGPDPDSSIPLAGPRSIQVTAGNQSLMLQWTKTAPAQGVIPFYEIYSSLSPAEGSAIKRGRVESNTSNLVRYEITGLDNHVTWYVWVKAVYPDLGESAFSPITYGTPIPPPAIPTGLAVASGEEMLEVTWDPTPDAFTYEVYYRENGSNGTPPQDASIKTVSETGAALLGLSNGTSYTIWVRAANTAGNSPGYASASGTPRNASAPPAAAPAELALTPGNNKLTAEWDQVSGVPGYKVYYGTANDFSQAQEFGSVPAAAPRVSADITGLSNGVLYYVWVQSWNSQSARQNSPVSPAASGKPVARDPVDFTNPRFELGSAAAEYIFAQDLPKSVFFPDGRPNTDRLTRVQETALGNLFTDGAAWYVRNILKKPIDFVFLNGGYIDNALSRGTITVGGISAITQPDARSDKIVIITMKGDMLKLFFQDVEGRVDGEGDVAGVVHTARGGPHNTGFFGIVSADARYTIQYYQPPGTKPDGTYDPNGSYEEISSRDAEPYYHGFIKPGTLLIGGGPIDDNREYRICTTDYLAAGGYFTRLFTSRTGIEPFDIPFWHGVAEYIYDQGVVAPRLDGRVSIEGGVPLPASAPWTPGGLKKP
ncbi:MAG: fibronectin type III domain-containing protein [Spirochaetaceae bacterium]|jgi:hypothetical protein|nr:fibronectin type III domain-containing protein [Spirochaetaceae bacterium]